MLSVTVTVKDVEALLPLPSAAEQFTVVLPAGKPLPGAGVQDTVTEPTASLAVGNAKPT